MSANPEMRVLHALRIKGFAETPLIAQVAELGEPETAQILATLAQAQLARFRDGRMTGWLLLPAGRSQGEALLAQELDRTESREALAELYRRFLEHNQPFLNLCTRWQTREVGGEVTVNDHTDPDYDTAVMAELQATHQAMSGTWSELGELLDRFGGYGPRFAYALDQLTNGNLDWFTKPIIDSYHTVWFELHEDLLASLGIERTKEARP